MRLHRGGGLPSARLCGQEGRFEEHSEVLEVAGWTLLARRGQSRPHRHQKEKVACIALSRDSKQERSKHLCMQPCTPEKSRSHSCSTAWRLNHGSPSSSVLRLPLAARFQSTNISWSLRASSQLPSWSVRGAILAATAARAGERFCPAGGLILNQYLAGVNSRRVDLRAWQCIWSASCLFLACTERRPVQEACAETQQQAGMQRC